MKIQKTKQIENLSKIKIAKNLKKNKKHLHLQIKNKIRNEIQKRQ